MPAFICDYCHGMAGGLFRVTEADGTEARICLSCKRDVEHGRSGGRIPQNPEDQP